MESGVILILAKSASDVFVADIFFCAEHLRHYGSLGHQLGPRPPNQLQLTAMLHHNMILMVTTSPASSVVHAEESSCMSCSK